MHLIFRALVVGLFCLQLPNSYADLADLADVAGLADPTKPYLQLDSFIFSEPVSIKHALDDSRYADNDYKSGGRNQYASLWIETGVRKGNWHSAVLYRESYRYRFSKDTADLYNSLNNTHTVDAGRLYQVDLNVERFRAQGIRLAYDWMPAEGIQIQFGGSYFQASHLLSGSLTGTAMANSSNDYDYQATVDYAYDKDILFGRSPVNAPHGSGVSLDLSGSWTINDRLSVSARVKDVYGRIRWRSAPASVGSLTSNTKTIGSDGFVVINPAIQGTHTIRDVYTQTIKPAGKVALQYQLEDTPGELHMKSRFFSDRVFVGVGGTRSVLQGQLSATIWPDMKVLELGYRNKKLNLTMGLDNLDITETRTFWLSMALH